SLDVLDKAGLLAPVMASLTAAIADHVERRAAGAYESAVVLFSQVRGELARSAGAEALIGRMTGGA
ncbi:MAG: cobalt-precorrin-6A synthase, partial [Coriobacteriia bacterium]|nr:cobalt-precorrin-6A synthase [Coriobacteriia bacterium]